MDFGIAPESIFKMIINIIIIINQIAQGEQERGQLKF